MVGGGCGWLCGLAKCALARIGMGGQWAVCKCMQRSTAPPHLLPCFFHLLPLQSGWPTCARTSATTAGGWTMCAASTAATSRITWRPLPPSLQWVSGWLVTGLSELGCLLLQLCLPDILLLRIPAGEYWDALSYEWDGTPSPCQDAHRQRTVNWINAAGGLATAFDITLKGVLHAGGRRLRDMKGGWIDVVQCLPQGAPTGVCPGASAVGRFPAGTSHSIIPAAYLA